MAAFAIVAATSCGFETYSEWLAAVSENQVSLHVTIDFAYQRRLGFVAEVVPCEVVRKQLAILEHSIDRLTEKPGIGAEAPHGSTIFGSIRTCDSAGTPCSSSSRKNVGSADRRDPDRRSHHLLLEEIACASSAMNRIAMPCENPVRSALHVGSQLISEETRYATSLKGHPDLHKHHEGPR